MKSYPKQFVCDPVTVAVRLALGMVFAAPGLALAEDVDARDLTRPTNFVEMGVVSTSQDSAKFGEYNGLTKVGGSSTASFKVQGGDSFGSFEGSKGVQRFEITGHDLGSPAREISGTVSRQGQWDMGLVYDELQHTFTDTYQTPYQGAMGGNAFVLPASFGVIDGAHRGPAGTGSQSMTASQLQSFQRQDVYTGRTNTGLRAGYQFDRQWSVRMDFNRLHQSGSKLMGVAVDGTGGAGPENVVTLMNPTSYQTDTYKLALHWKGDKGHVTGTLSSSVFQDGYDTLSWSNPFVDTGSVPPTTGAVGGAFPINTLATAPSNESSQIKLSGAYDLSQAMHLTGGFSYGRNTQNAGFINDPLLTSPLPVASLNGLIVNTHADLKLTHQTTPNLLLSAGLRYNQRDNQTPSYTYASFQSVAGDPWTGAVNAPVSNQSTLFEFAGNYRINKMQSVLLSYELDKTKQWCANPLANSAQSPDVIDPKNFPGYYVTPACVESPDSTDHKLLANYKLKVNDDLNLNAAYTHSRRSSTFNASHYNPMQTSVDGLQNLGFVSYFSASRTEQIVKAGANWQATDAMNLGLNGRYVKDTYDATLGVQQSSSYGLNLDAAYRYAPQGSVSGYLSLQHRTRDMLASADRSPLAVPGNIWSNQLSDDTKTIGITAQQQGLMGGKLTLTGDLSHSLGTSAYSTQLQYANVLCDTYGITCGTMPDIRNQTTRIQLTGAYQLDKSSKAVLGYVFQKLISDDYYYSAYQTNMTDVTVLPTNQQSPTHSVGAIGVSYIYSFQ